MIRGITSSEDPDTMLRKAQCGGPLCADSRPCRWGPGVSFPVAARCKLRYGERAQIQGFILFASQPPRSGQTQFGDSDPKIAYSRVFFGLLRVQRSLMPEIEKSLRELGIRDPVWYEILYAVEQSGDSGVQMLALEERLAIPQYALSRHVARMETAGLIRREPVPGAGRGQSLHLTERSSGLQDRVWQVYVQRIQAAMAPHLTTDEAYDLVRYLNRLYR